MSSDSQSLWTTVLSEIELSVSRPTFRTHFSTTKLLTYENGVATIGVTNHVIQSFLESRYYSLIKNILDARTRENSSLVFRVMPQEPSQTKATAAPLFEERREYSPERLPDIARKLRIRPDYTFGNFAVSTTNQMAHAAATAVAASPGKAYNPLFLYGGVGVGKTHLMHAIANTLLEKNQRTHIVSCMGEEFLNEIIEAIQTKTARQFKQKYRTAKLLLVDDVQFIAGKQTAQEEFFHTFNAVNREGGQIVLTSDKHPSEISRLEERLRSRFEGGLIVDVAKPDFELRAAIVHIKSQTRGLQIPPDAAQMVAANITDTRAIEGFLQKLATYLSTKPVPISVDLVASLLGKNNKTSSHPQTPSRVYPQDVVDAVASRFQLKASQLKGPRRMRAVVKPRQILMYLCKNDLGMTLQEIGSLLGGRDHSTVIHGVDAVVRELPSDPGLQEAITDIRNSLWQ